MEKGKEQKEYKGELGICFVAILFYFSNSA
jgi:hypothetical protein